MTFPFQRRPFGRKRTAPIRFAIVAIVAVLASSTPGALGAELVIVTGKTTPIDSLQEEQAKGLWLATVDRIEGTRLDVADRSDSQIRTEFYSRLLHKTRGQMKAIRAKRAFQFGLAPPPEFPSDESVLEWVRGRPNRLGYVDARTVAEGKGEGIKILLVLDPSKEGE